MKNWIAALFAVTLIFTDAGCSSNSTDNAQGPSLKVGDPAPPLLVEKWVKGEPVEKFEPGTVYVLECWSTTCPPCLETIPHVTALQEKYNSQGVVVIGMSIWELDQAEVEPFVRKMGDKMNYRVATEPMEDDAEDGGKMVETWMNPAGENEIPCSFIIDRAGKIAWIGDPRELEEPLAAVVAGKKIQTKR